MEKFHMMILLKQQRKNFLNKRVKKSLKIQEEDHYCKFLNFYFQNINYFLNLLNRSNSSATTISKRSVKGTNQSLYSDESYDNLDKEFDVNNF